MNTLTSKVLMLVFSLTSLSLSANECDTVSTQSNGALGEFEKDILSLGTRARINGNIRNKLCSQGRLESFLTGGQTYQYGKCFIPAAEIKTFNNADDRQSRSQLNTFRTRCISWAEKRYWILIAQAETKSRKIQAEKSLQLASRKREQATTEAKAQMARLKKDQPSWQQAILAAQKPYAKTALQWSSEAGMAQQTSSELAAYLFATDLTASTGETQASNKHLQQHLNELLGQPQITAIKATKKSNEYRVHIQSQHSDYTIKVLVKTGKPPGKKVTPWILFTRENQKITPVAVVLRTPEQVITSSQLESQNLPLTSLPDRNVTRLTNLTGNIQIQLHCVPHDGGQAMTLSQCLKPDGEINLITNNTNEQFAYANLPRKQRNYQAHIKPPFILLARTGNANRRGELQIKIIDLTQNDKPAVFENRVIARRSSLFVYSE